MIQSVLQQTEPIKNEPEQKWPMDLLTFLNKINYHPYEIVTIMIQMAQLVDEYHKKNQTLGRFNVGDFMIQLIPNTNNYQVNFNGQPLYNEIYDLMGQANHDKQQMYEAPELYDIYLDYQCDIYQLGVWFAFMITRKYINYENTNQLEAFQDYIPQVTWVIQSMLDKTPCCRPGLDVVIERLLKFEFKGKIVINQGTFIVKKLSSFKTTTKLQQFYSLTYESDNDKGSEKYKDFKIELSSVKEIRVQFINCFYLYKSSKNRDRQSNLINTIIRIKPKEKDFIYFRGNQEGYQMEEKQFKNEQFETFFFKQQSKILFFQFKYPQSGREVDINLILKQELEQREFVVLKYLDCYIHILDIQQIIDQYEDKDNLKNQAKLQFNWHGKQLLLNQKEQGNRKQLLLNEKERKHLLVNEKEWQNPQFFWKIKSNKCLEGMFYLIEPETELGSFKEEKADKIGSFIKKFQDFLLYLKELGLTLRRLSFDSQSSSYFKENLPLNCIHLRNFKEQSYQLILKKFYRVSIDFINKEISDIVKNIQQQIPKDENKLKVLNADKSKLEVLRDDLLYKLNYY